MITTVNDKVRYLNKNNNANERENYSKWWKEQIEHYGTSVTYFTNGYTLTGHNFVYGEDPTSTYVKTADVIMLTDITNDALMLSKFGIMADCDMTAVVHISSFYDKFGCGREPKSGDLIQLTEYGADRPGGRSAPIYEITERDDENLQLNANHLMGHYIWVIKCKRFEYSYEPGIENAPNNKQISDGGDYGRLPGGDNPEELFQPYPDSAPNSAKCIYDYYSEDPTGLELNPNHYIPPNPPSCPNNLSVTGLSAVPGPYENTNEPELIAALQFIETNMNDVVLRQNVSSQPGNLDTFVLTTSGKPEDVIIYQTNNDTVVLDNIAGSGIVSDTEEPLDGGTF